MNKLGETNCHDCYYATKINTDTYRCRRKRYDIVKKSCFVPKTEKDRDCRAMEAGVENGKHALRADDKVQGGDKHNEQDIQCGSS